MTSLQNRLKVLESKQVKVDLDGMADAELDSHLGALKAGSPDWFRVMLTGIWRWGSKLPISTAR